MPDYDMDKVHYFEYKGYSIEGPSMRYRTYAPDGQQVDIGDGFGSTVGHSYAEIKSLIDKLQATLKTEPFTRVKVAW